jgi:hypothetical protein
MIQPSSYVFVYIEKPMNGQPFACGTSPASTCTPIPIASAAETGARTHGSARL